MGSRSNILLVGALALVPPSPARAGGWGIDPAHSAAQFSVRHMMVSTVRGQFSKVTGTLNLDEQDVTKSAVEVSIDATTIDTGQPDRDDHLKSPAFFDVAKNPTITFKSTSVKSADGGRLEVVGDLTMHGVTHPVTLVVDGPTPAIKNPWGKMVRGVSATGTLDRKDWGLTWNKVLESGGVMIGEEIHLQIDAELGAQEPPAAPAPAAR